MAMVYSLEGLTPIIDPSAFVHETAVLIGDVQVGAGTYVGPHVSLRGDFGRIVIGRGASVQDCCVMHGYPGADTMVGDDASIGHGAVVHSARIGARALVGMNAVVNDNAEIGEDSVIAAMSFIRAGMVVPARSMVVGIPGRILRQLSDTELAWQRQGSRVYQELAQRCRAGLVPATPLTAPEPNRARLDWGAIRPLSDMKRA
jgi:phenylacetic acid degradation protein